MTASILLNATSTLSEGTSSDSLYTQTPLTLTFQGVAGQGVVSNVILKPQQSITLIQPTAALVYTLSTAWTVSYPRVGEPNVARITSDSVVFRTARALGANASTVVSVIRLSQTVMRLTVLSGPLSTASVLIGDDLLLERSTDAFSSPFATANQGLPCVVVGKTATTIDFWDNGAFVDDVSVTLGSAYATILKVLSKDAALPGDVLYVRSSQFGYSNRGSFVISFASDDYVEFVSGSAAPESVTSVDAEGVIVAGQVARYLAMSASGSVEIFCAGQTEPTLISAQSGSAPIALLTLNTPSLRVRNPSIQDDVRIVAQVGVSPASSSCIS